MLMESTKRGKLETTWWSPLVAGRRSASRLDPSGSPDVWNFNCEHLYIYTHGGCQRGSFLVKKTEFVAATGQKKRPSRITWRLELQLLVRSRCLIMKIGTQIKMPFEKNKNMMQGLIIFSLLIC